MNIRLLKQQGFALEHHALCPRCSAEYHFNTQRNEGCADFVNVSCGDCGLLLGRVRSDFGGDIRLNTVERLQVV